MSECKCQSEIPPSAPDPSVVRNLLERAEGYVENCAAHFGDRAYQLTAEIWLAEYRTLFPTAPKSEDATKEEPMNEIPRRIRMDQWSKAEKAIYEAMQTVESMGADPALTDAVVLLGQAKDRVADFVDSHEFQRDDHGEFYVKKPAGKRL